MNRTLWLLTVVLALLTSAVTAQKRPTGFQVGDRILLRVEGDSALSDTFTVVSGPALRLPNVGEITLAGVPRNDIEAHLTRALGVYLKDPVVQARALVRVSVAGDVVHPGFYAVPTDLVLADALMLAGGAMPTARVDQMRIVRGSSSLWSGSALQSAIARGATLEDLGVRAGDGIQVPGHGDPESKWRIIGIFVTSIAAAVTVVAVTSHR